MEPISPKHITVTDPFWAPRIRTVADIVLPYQWQVLHDQVPGAPKSSCIANFQKAAHAIAAAKAGRPRPTYPTDKWYYDDKNSQEKAFMGWVFQDSDLYKWLEAAAYAIPYGNRAYLTEKSREAVEIIAAAQETDGYLDTLYSINGLQNRFTNLKDYHELYCFGHLAQAACARWTMQGERDLLDIACRAADCICRTFGKGKRPGYPGHPLAELALVQLYEVTGKADYLQTADFFIRTRGTRPLFFDRERGVDTDGSDYIYNQAHCPLTAQTTAVGHAVRGVYLYAGAAAVAEHTGNRALQAACETLWQDLCRTKLYVTGALGQTAVGEAFGPAYYLPNDLAYGESCASAGLVFFAQRLYSNTRVGANAGRVALSRGGLIYALETQGAPSIHALTLDSKSPIVYRGGCLLAAGTCLQPSDHLYTTSPPKAVPRTLRFIPFCRRLNGKEDQMAVWVRTTD